MYIGKHYSNVVLGRMEFTIVKNTVTIDSDRERMDSDVVIIRGKEELMALRDAIDLALQADA